MQQVCQVPVPVLLFIVIPAEYEGLEEAVLVACTVA